TLQLSVGAGAIAPLHWPTCPLAPQSALPYWQLPTGTGAGQTIVCPLDVSEHVSEAPRVQVQPSSPLPLQLSSMPPLQSSGAFGNVLGARSSQSSAGIPAASFQPFGGQQSATVVPIGQGSGSIVQAAGGDEGRSYEQMWSLGYPSALRPE